MRDAVREDEDLMRAAIEASLLQIGVPYDALEKASEEQVLRWYAVTVEQRTEGERP
jgi:hypothetical protein